MQRVDEKNKKQATDPQPAGEEQTPVVPKGEMSRRQFLNYTFGGVFGLIVVGMLWPVIGEAAVPALTAKPSNGSGSSLGKVGDFNEKDFKSITFQVPAKEGWYEHKTTVNVYVRKDPKWSKTGGFVAISPICTHLGCLVSWEPQRNIFLCPCHGSEFDKYGRVVHPPAPRPLDYFDITVKNGQVILGADHPRNSPDEGGWG